MIFLGSKWADSSTSRTICMPSNRYSSTSLTLRWENIFNQYPNKRKSAQLLKSTIERFLVGVPGLEPGKAGPESAVLPLHHTPNWDWQSQCKSSAESLLFAEMQPDFAEHFLEMRCKGSGFFRNNKEKTHFFIKNPKIFCFYCTFRIIPCIFVGQNNIFNI